MHFRPPVFTTTNPFMNEIHLLAKAVKMVTCRGLIHGNLHKMIPERRFEHYVLKIMEFVKFTLFV